MEGDKTVWILVLFMIVLLFALTRSKGNTPTSKEKKSGQPRVKLPKEKRKVDNFGNVICPDCGNTDWIQLTGGASFGNIECDNPGCSSRFNDLGPFGLQRIMP